jgi:hypothetical protein
MFEFELIEEQRVISTLYSWLLIIAADFADSRGGGGNFCCVAGEIPPPPRISVGNRCVRDYYKVRA